MLIEDFIRANFWSSEYNPNKDNRYHFKYRASFSMKSFQSNNFFQLFLKYLFMQKVPLWWKAVFLFFNAGEFSTTYNLYRTSAAIYIYIIVHVEGNERWVLGRDAQFRSFWFIYPPPQISAFDCPLYLVWAWFWVHSIKLKPQYERMKARSNHS